MRALRNRSTLGSVQGKSKEKRFPSTGSFSHTKNATILGMGFFSIQKTVAEKKLGGSI